MIELEVNKFEIPKSHCECCGMKTSEENPINKLSSGPYRWICLDCKRKEYLWDPNRTLDRPQCVIGTYEIPKNQDKIKVLLVEPDYYSRFPPLGLLKLAAYHKKLGHEVQLIKMDRKLNIRIKPDIIYVTSLFTWSWKSVWNAISKLRILFGETKIILGGIYASIIPDHASYSGADFIHVGLLDQVEDEIPAYEFIPEWNGSILFATRGCIRKCSFCVVPKLEGNKIINPKHDISSYIYPKHDFVYFWDNNILGSENFFTVANQLQKKRLKVDFNQGLDARLVTAEIALILKKIKQPLLHLAYDTKASRSGVKRAIELLKEVGFNGKKMVFYTLYNFKDTPTDFLQRLKDLMKWGVVSYPMRYEPLNCLEKGNYISPNWTKEELDLVVKARRVLAPKSNGAFVPYPELVNKIVRARNLEEALSLEPIGSMQNHSLEEYF